MKETAVEGAPAVQRDVHKGGEFRLKQEREMNKASRIERKKASLNRVEKSSQAPRTGQFKP